MGQVRDFCLYPNSKWEATRALIQGRNEDGSGHSQVSELFWKISPTTIRSLNWGGGGGWRDQLQAVQKSR